MNNLETLKAKAQKFDDIINLLNTDNGKTFLGFNSTLEILNNDLLKDNKLLKEKYNASDKVIKTMLKMQNLNNSILTIIEK